MSISSLIFLKYVNNIKKLKLIMFKDLHNTIEWCEQNEVHKLDSTLLTTLK